MRAVAVTALVSLPLAAAEGTAVKPKNKTPEQAKSDHIRELLDKAAETVTGAQPQVQVAALMHVAANYPERKKALELIDQAFAAAGGMPTARERAQLQGEILGIAAALDANKALDLLKQMPPPESKSFDVRSSSVAAVINGLIQKKQFDQALEAIEVAANGGVFPYQAGSALMRVLPEDDPRRLEIFTRASANFTGERSDAYARFISRTWKSVPREMAGTAVRNLVNSILDRKDDDPQLATISGPKGSVALGTRKEYDLFNAMPILKEVDPKRAQEILDKYPDLSGALSRFPGGTDSMCEDPDNCRMSTSVSSRSRDDTPDPQDELRMRQHAIASTQFSRGMQLLKDDPEKALTLARSMDHKRYQLDLLAAIVNAVGDKDPTTAKSIVSQGMSILSETKEPGAEPWVRMAEAAHKVHDDERAWYALGKGIEEAERMYKEDSDAEAPNRALREYWPSTQAFRTVVHKAAQMYGSESESLLTKITDPDLRVLATIHLAQGLAGRDRGDVSVSVNRTRR